MKHILHTANTGDVLAVSLSKGEFGYVRIFNGACLGVIPIISQGLVREVRLLANTQARWFLDYAAPATDKTEMIRVGEIPFEGFNAAWPPARYVPPDMFKNYFQIYERGMRRPASEEEAKALQKAQRVTPESLQRFIEDQRAQCTLVEIDSPAASSTIAPDIASDSIEPMLLEIVFRNKDFPFKGRDAVEEPVAEALEASGMGEVTGGGSGPETTAIDVEVLDLTRALEIIRQTLRDLGCPSSTEIHQHQPQHVVHRL